MLFLFDCEQTCNSASDGECRHSSDAETRNSVTHLEVVLRPNLHVYVQRGSGVLSDIFVTWDRATLEFESSNQFAEGIIMLAWHKQQIVIY